MPGRTSKLALAAGSAVVLALGIGLFELTRSSAPPPARAAAASAAVAQAAAAPAATPVATRPGAAREPMAAAAPRAHTGGPGPQPQLAPALGSFTRALKRDANGHLVPIVTMKELRAQMSRTEAPMQACLQRFGAGATGKATLSFTVATRNGQLAVETTSAQDEDTLAGHPNLLDCMHRTAYALQLDDKPVPELGTPIYVRRHVRVDHGELAEDTFFDFSYNP